MRISPDEAEGVRHVAAFIPVSSEWLADLAGVQEIHAQLLSDLHEALLYPRTRIEYVTLENGELGVMRAADLVSFDDEDLGCDCGCPCCS